MKLLALTSIVILISGCANQTLKKPKIIYDNAVIDNKSEVKKNDKPLQIATWSPTKYDGRFTGMGFGYLTTFGNCLTMTMESKEIITKDNTYLLGRVEHS